MVKCDSEILDEIEFIIRKWNNIPSKLTDKDAIETIFNIIEQRY